MGNTKDKDFKVGHIGETYVLHQLAKLGIYGLLTQHRFEYDILTNTNLRIEVKTSKILQKSKNLPRGKMCYSNCWTFNNHGYKDGKQTKRNRLCDYFVFVCLDDGLDVTKSYIVPKRIIKDKILITIPTSGNTKFEPYYERWDLLKKKEGRA